MAGLCLLPPCNWCGHPSGEWCELCHEVAPGVPAHHLCSTCEAAMRMCRLCRLTRQIDATRRNADGRAMAQPSIRPCPDSAWMGTSQCGSCGHKGWGLKQCQQCRVVRYCGPQCQKRHWAKHKRLCFFLCEMQPLTFVYPWHRERGHALTRQHPEMFPPVRFFAEEERSPDFD